MTADRIDEHVAAQLLRFQRLNEERSDADPSCTAPTFLSTKSRL